MAEQSALWGWDNTNKVWAKLLVDAGGRILAVGTVALLDDIGDVNVPAPGAGQVLTWDAVALEWVAAAGGGGLHHLTHENGGADEISVAGLSGVLADAQTPIAHHLTHENGGADEISVLGLSGLLADGQTPLGHHASHESGGGDAIKLDDLATPDDNTDLNATTAKHGLLPKLSDVATEFLNGDGGWAVPAGGAGATIVRKTADEAVNNSTVLQDDNHLLLAVGANEVWLFEFYLLQQSVSTTADIKFGFSYPAGCTIYWGIPSENWVGVATANDPTSVTIETGTRSKGTGNRTQAIWMSAIVVNGANAGTVNLQWAQATATVEDTKMLTNSVLLAHKVA